jgi:hypothetical protein
VIGYMIGVLLLKNIQLRELLFFMYDISLPDTDISYYRDIKTA